MGNRFILKNLGAQQDLGAVRIFHFPVCSSFKAFSCSKIVEYVKNQYSPKSSHRGQIIITCSITSIEQSETLKSLRTCVQIYTRDFSRAGRLSTRTVELISKKLYIQ